MAGTLEDGSFGFLIFLPVMFLQPPPFRKKSPRTAFSDDPGFD